MTQTLLAGVILLASGIAVAAAADVLGPTEKKTIVRDLLKSFETRDLAPMHTSTKRNTSSTIQNVEDGKAGLKTLLARLPEDTKIETLRNKAVVKAYWDAVVLGGEANRVAEFRSMDDFRKGFFAQVARTVGPYVSSGQVEIFEGETPSDARHSIASCIRPHARSYPLRA